MNWLTALINLGFLIMFVPALSGSLLAPMFTASVARRPGAKRLTKLISAFPLFIGLAQLVSWPLLFIGLQPAALVAALVPAAGLAAVIRVYCLVLTFSRKPTYRPKAGMAKKNSQEQGPA